jgi:hypothetical protein
MASRPQFSNAFKPPVESGGALSRNEQVRRRINTIINSREKVNDLPLIDAQTAMVNQMEAAAAQAAKVVQQNLSREISQLPPDPVEYAKQAELLAQAEKAAAIVAAQQATEQARVADASDAEVAPDQPTDNVERLPVKAKPEEVAARKIVSDAFKDAA